MARQRSLSARLRQAGIYHTAKAAPWFGEDGPLHPVADDDEFFQALSHSADPDVTLLTLMMLGDNSHYRTVSAALNDYSITDLQRFINLSGTSRMLGEYVAARPHLLPRVITDRDRYYRPFALVDDGQPVGLVSDYDPVAEQRAVDQWADDAATVMDQIIADGGQGPVDCLRNAYFQILLTLATDDICDPQPTVRLSYTTRQLTALTQMTITRAYQMAKHHVDPDDSVRLAVIAMGKTGARELNYISDVDVIYVAKPRHHTMDERTAMEKAAEIATFMATVCSGPGEEPPLWPLDASLRPEGNDGVLVRTVESYDTYYRSWAQSWEFQALLKARPIAGDAQLGRQFMECVTPLVWSASTRDDFVHDARKMRQRVEEHIPRRDVDRQLKLGPGGLRDVEFSVQLLQMVHGRVDTSLRVANTLQAIDALSAGGYISRHSARVLASCYRFLRVVEHRAQLFRRRRTHLIPRKDDAVRQLAHSVGFATAEELLDVWHDTRDTVRALHRELFYRPLLPALAQLSDQEAALSEEAQYDRLAFIGYQDPRRAVEHIKHLTAGTSRTAQIQRAILPVLLGWLADGPQPDFGLLSFRILSETIGSSHWYMATLRDSTVVAQRLTVILSTSRYVAHALPSTPLSVQWLEEGDGLQPRDPQVLRQQALALVSRHEDLTTAAQRLVDMRRREMIRSAMGDIMDGVDPTRATTMINPVNDAVMQALVQAVRDELDEFSPDEVAIAIIAMGRYGGCEPSYASDADIAIVHRSATGVDPQAATRYAQQFAVTLHDVSTRVGDPVFRFPVDMALRPEGNDGPLSRSFQAYQHYYDTWADAWERQALIRARVVYADGDLGYDVTQVINRVRYGPAPTDRDVKEIRRLKARMEHERLPRGADPKRHVKLGTGGLSDVEWCVQLLQMQHAHTSPSLYTTQTLPALDALVDGGFISNSDGDTLRQAWILAARIRAANVLAYGRVTGKKLDLLPRNVELKVVASMLGYETDKIHELEEDYLRSARRARAVMERVFYEG